MNKVTLKAGLVAGVVSLWTVGQAIAAGGTVEEKRDASGFTRIEVGGSMDTFVTTGEAFSVTVKADADIIDRVKTDVIGSTLEIGMKRGSYRRIDVLEIYITMPSLDGLELNGSGDIAVNAVDGDELELELRGSGDIEIAKADVKAVDLDLRGSGDVEVTGRCDTVEVNLRGSGDVDFGDLECDEARVEIRGSGDVDVYARNAFDGSVYGSGDIKVSGKPKKTASRSRGSGDIILR